MRKKDRQGQPVSNVLICGNTKLLEEKIVRDLSGFYRVLVAGEISMPVFHANKISFYPDKPSTQRFSQLCHAFSPDVVWYFSGFADGGEGFADETRMIVELIWNLIDMLYEEQNV